MQPLQSTLLRSARSLRILRAPKSKILPPLWAANTSRRNISVTQNRREEEDIADNMAPKGQKFELKTPKGTKDWDGKDMVIRDKIFNTITDAFKRHGAVTIDTPVFELRDILTGKYGEDSKLIYDLADQGGEICSLRYDLTVPFARWLAMNQHITSIKRYHIAKVYRRDQPAMAKGRMREFYQCDFDIAGTYDSMLPDAEIVRITSEIFEGLGWKDRYTIKLNHRKVLDGLFEVCGVPEDKIRTISSAVDKLDKSPWVEVRKEMVEEKGLSEEAADKIGEWVVHKGQKDLLAKLQADEKIMANEKMKTGLAEMELLFTYLEAFKALENVSFDLSLARGLDYYTGVIFEVVTEGSAPAASTSTAPAAPSRSSKKPKSTDADEDRSSDPSVGVGSVAAGGRYDNLVGMFTGKKQIPCVGISFGVDRIFSITKARMEADAAAEVRNSEVDVYVMALGGKGFTGLLPERMSVCAKLWEAGIKAEFQYKIKPKFQTQFQKVDDAKIPLSVILGEDEVAQGKIKIKENGLRPGHPEKEGVLIDLDDLVFEVRKRMNRKANLDHQFQQADGLRVVGGIKSDGTEKTEESLPEEAAKPLVEEAKAETSAAEPEAAEPKVEKSVEEPKVEKSTEEPKVEQLTLVEPTPVAERKGETSKEEPSPSQLSTEAISKS